MEKKCIAGKVHSYLGTKKYYSLGLLPIFYHTKIARILGKCSQLLHPLVLARNVFIFLIAFNYMHNIFSS